MGKKKYDEVKTAPVIETTAERARKTETAVECPECGKDAAFVVSTRTHPAFIENRLRRYKCRACGHPFKISK